MLVTLVSVALLRGTIFGAVAGFGAGLVVDTATLQTLGVSSLLLTIAGYWIGRYGETTGRDRTHAPFVSVAVVTILYRQNQGTSAPAKANTVVMAQIAFNPKTLTAAKGSEVVFENKDVAPHNVTADNPKISSGTIAPGKAFRLVVQQPFEYRCTIHPGMDAKVVLAG